MFPKSLPTVKLFKEIRETAPDWYRAGNGAWGCLRTHLAIWEQFLESSYDMQFVFENDVVFREDFDEKFYLARKELPSDWDILYIGGQVLGDDSVLTRPKKIKKYLYRVYNINRTHAYVINRTPNILKVYELIRSSHDRRTENFIGEHIDTLLGACLKDINAFIILPQLAGQKAGVSSITGKQVSERWWLHNGYN